MFRPAPRRSRFAPWLCLAFAAPAPLLAQGSVVVPPPGWFKGETHDHLQFCTSSTSRHPGARGTFFLDQTTSDIYAAMLGTGLAASNVMIWNNGSLGPQIALDTFGPLVTGMEDPASAGDPNHVIQVGLETSGFPVSTLGHVSFLNIFDPYFDYDLDLPYQAIDFFRLQPGAVVGAPHQIFPRDLCSDLDGATPGFTNPPGYDFVSDRVCDLSTQGLAFPTFEHPNLFPFLLPLDVVSGRIDYLEAIDLTYDVGPIGFSPANVWSGLYYKLLSLGRHISIGGGNDVNCAVTSSSLPCRTYAFIPNQTLTFAGWSRSVADGRVTLAMGDDQLLLVSVGGRLPGSQVSISAGTPQQANVQLIAAPGTPIDDSIELVFNGNVVSVSKVDLPAGGTFSRNISIAPQKSGWLLARTQSQSAHTAAVYIVVDSQPIADLLTAEYMKSYCGYLDWNLDIAEQAGVVEDIVGDSLAEVRAYIDDGRRLFTSMSEFADVLPADASRYGVSSPIQGGSPMPIVIDDVPDEGGTLTLSLFDGPPGGTANLIVSTGQTSGTYLNGARLFVDLGTTIESYTATINNMGHAQVSFPALPGDGTFVVYMQFLVTNPVGSDLLYSSTDALTVTY